MRTCQMRTVPIAVILAVLAPAPAAGTDTWAPRAGAEHVVPLHGELIHPFDAPEDQPYAAGHRGVDVAAPAGSPVRSSAAGTVTFAGSVAGNRAVTVDHGGGVRTTYSYLGSISVAQGSTVDGGDEVGRVGAGHSPDDPPHVHLAARRDERYFDPLRLYLGDSHADLLRLVGGADASG